MAPQGKYHVSWCYRLPKYHTYHSVLHKTYIYPEKWFSVSVPWCRMWVRLGSDCGLAPASTWLKIFVSHSCTSVVSLRKNELAPKKVRLFFCYWFLQEVLAFVRITAKYYQKPQNRQICQCRYETQTPASPGQLAIQLLQLCVHVQWHIHLIWLSMEL